MRVPYVVWRRYHIHVVLAVLLLQSTALLASGDCSSVQGLWAQTVTDGIIDRNQMTYYNNGVQSALNQQKKHKSDAQKHRQCIGCNQSG
eukprot:gene1756-biopygen1318